MSPAYWRIEAEPCPFCGSKELTVAPQAAWYAVSCENCDAEGPESKDRQRALDLWNTRHQPQPAPTSESVK